MTRLPPIDPNDRVAAEALASVGRLTGRPSDMAKILAHSPGPLQYLMPFLVALQRKGLGSVAAARHKELAILRTSMLNGCAG